MTRQRRQRLFNRTDRIRLTGGNIFEIDGCPAFRWLPERGALQFIDRDRRRSEARGKRYVEVDLARLVEVLRDGDENI